MNNKRHIFKISCIKLNQSNNTSGTTSATINSISIDGTLKPVHTTDYQLKICSGLPRVASQEFFTHGIKRNKALVEKVLI